MLGAKIVLVPLVFDPAADMSFVVPRVLLSHAFAYLLAGVIAALLIRFGRDFIVWSWVHVPVLAFITASVLATIFAVDLALALYGTHGRMLGLGTIADFVLTYFAVVLLVRTRVEAVALVACGLGVSLLVLAYELVQLAGLDPFSWTINVTVAPISTIGQPTTLANYLTSIAVFCFALGTFASGIPKVGRAGLITYSGFLLAGAAATGTRSAVIGVGLGIGVLILFLWVRSPSRRARMTIAAGSLVAAAGLVALLSLTPLGARLTSTIQRPAVGDDQGLAELDPSSLSRLTLYGMALRMIEERPLLGYGPDSFSAGVPRYRPESAPIDLRQSVASSAHSWIAHVAVSSGLLGLLSMGAVIALVFVSALRSAIHPVIVAITALFAALLGTGLTTVNDVITDTMFWMSAGAIAAGTIRASPRDEVDQLSGRRRAANQRRPARTQLLQIAALGCVLAGVVLAPLAIAALDASRSIRSSESSRLLNKSPQAIELGLRAVRSDPNRAEYWHQLGLAYVGGSRWREATAAFDRAHQLAPYQVRYMNDAVSVQIILVIGGDAEARATAIKLADQAIKADPNNPSVHLSRATVSQATGDLPQALVSVERALALDPQSDSLRLYITAAQIFLDSGRPAEALRIARQGIAMFDSVEVTARSAPLRYELARALATLGQVQEALTELDLVLKIQPNYPAAEQLRSQLRAQVRN